MTDHRHMDDLAVTAPVSPMPADLGVLADEWGLFCAADARQAGVGPARLAGLVGSGAVTSVWRGWYAVGAPESRERLHLLRALAAQRSMRVPTTLSHYSELANLSTLGASDLVFCRPLPGNVSAPRGGSVHEGARSVP